jgi:hypothetical protein
MRLWRPALCLLASFLGISPGCSYWVPDLLEQRRFQSVEPIYLLAVVPFYPHPMLSAAGAEPGASAGDAAALITRFVTEALAARPVAVIPESDVRLAFEGHAQVMPRQEPEPVALLAASEFGADAVLLGQVRRFREREGSAYGSLAPASVDFEVSLYSAPDATLLWTARFEQTQAPLTSDFFQSARLPSGGTRFLTVAELARFGAGLVAEELPLGR